MDADGRNRIRTGSGAALAVCALIAAGPVAAQAPMSAIDWLSHSLTAPPGPAGPSGAPADAEASGDGNGAVAGLAPGELRPSGAWPEGGSGVGSGFGAGPGEWPDAPGTGGWDPDYIPPWHAPDRTAGIPPGFGETDSPPPATGPFDRTGPIEMRPLDAEGGAMRPDAVGLMPASRLGLPSDIWQGSRSAEIAARMARLRPDTLPAVRDLAYALLLGEFTPPGDADAAARLLTARIDALTEFGALDQAQALLEAAGSLTGPAGAALFARRFDIALLLSDEDRACAELATQRMAAPSVAARVFCLARGGDWASAALTLETAAALDLIDPVEAQLVRHFLDPEADDAPMLAPGRMAPLHWRMLDATGEAPPTGALPLAFAHADLGPASPWRAQMEAAERLTRSGALTPNRLLGLYTERRPAASGGVWDRAAAVQRLEAALRSGDEAALGEALMRVWPRMQEVGLETAFAALYSEALERPGLSGRAASLRFEIALLGSAYEDAARAHAPRSAREAFLVALADGRPEAAPPPGPLAEAVRDGFDAPPLTEPLAGLIAEGRTGEALLEVLERLQTGAEGELRAVTQGVAGLRALGLEATARRAGLQLLLLETRG